jgi:hypothetical protein
VVSDPRRRRRVEMWKSPERISTFPQRITKKT